MNIMGATQMEELDRSTISSNEHIQMFWSALLRFNAQESAASLHELQHTLVRVEVSHMPITPIDKWDERV